MAYRGNMKKRMAKASAEGAAFAIIIGDDELGRGVAALKTLDTGEQQDVAARSPCRGARRPMTIISAERIAQIEARRDELQAQMATGDLPSDRFVAVSKEYAELEPVAARGGRRAAAARRARRARGDGG